MGQRRLGNTKSSKGNISGGRSKCDCNQESYFCQGQGTRSKERLRRGCMASTEKRAAYKIYGCLSHTVQQRHWFWWIMKTGMIARALPMTWIICCFGLTSLPCVDPLPTQEADMYQASLRSAHRRHCYDGTRAQDCADPCGSFNSVGKCCRLHTSMAYEINVSRLL